MKTNTEKTAKKIEDLNYTELEDRLEMAQVAFATTNRCGGSSSDQIKKEE